MKNKMFLGILIFIALFFAIVPVAYAVTGGSQGFSGGGGGYVGSGDCAAGIMDAGTNWGSTKTYLFDLVYRSSETADIKYLGCAIIGPYADSVNNYSSVHKNCKKYTSLGSANSQMEAAKSLKNVARYIDESGNASDLKEEINADAKNILKTYLYELGLADSNKKISRETNKALSDDNDADPGKKGYRILIQRINKFGCGSNWNILGPRKEVSNVSVLIGSSAQPDLWTDHKDIGISAGKSPGSASASNYMDKNDGTGYNIIWFDADKIVNKYNYSIDAACEGCDGDNDRASLFVQDTTNWNAIKESKDVAEEVDVDGHVSRHYYKNSNVYCREEYNIKYPNSSPQTSGKIYVDKGSYFTVGLSQALENHPNFGPIEVTRTMECKSDSMTKLKQFSTASKLKTAGTVDLCYIEGDQLRRINVNGQKYTVSSCTWQGRLNSKSYSVNLIHYGNDYDKLISTMIYNKNTIDNSSKTLIKKITYRYTLPTYLYRYISKGGISQYKKPTGNLNMYTDVGIPNLPVSSNINYRELSDTTKLVGAIQLKYNFPSASDDTHNKTYLGEAFNASSQANYWGSDNVNKNSNIYANDIDGEYKKDTACAKMFGLNSSKFESCAAARRDASKIGNCKKLNKGTASEGYVCPIKVAEECIFEDDVCKIVKTNGSKEVVSCQSVASNKCNAYEKCIFNGSGKCLIEYYNSNGKITKTKNVRCADEAYKDICPPEECTYIGNGDCKMVTKNSAGLIVSERNVSCGDYKETCPLPDGCTDLGGGKCEVVINGKSEVKSCSSDIVKKLFPNCPCKDCENHCEKLTDNLCRIYSIKNGIRKELYDLPCSEAESKSNYLAENCKPGGGGDDEENSSCKAVDLNNDKCVLSFYKNGVTRRTNVSCSAYPKKCPCPSGGCPNGVVVYRTVDLTNPFPGISGSTGGRDSGSNWCYRDINGNLKCKTSNSKVVQNVITNKGESVYDDSKVMYSFRLDSSDIKFINNNYNKNKSYSDFTLDCDKNGEACVSNVVHNNAYLVAGTCRSVTRGNGTFYSCRR